VEFLRVRLACQQLCNLRLQRIHLTCLTCLVRRYHYGKVDKQNFICLRKGKLFKLENWALPQLPAKGYTGYTYYLIININGNRFKRFVKRLALRLLQNIHNLFYGVPGKPKRGSFTVKTYQLTVFPLNAVWVPFTLKSGREVAYMMSGWDCVKANVFKTFCSFAEVIANW